MTHSTFFKHFDLLADQPGAVAKMRELVLQLAVRGKLLPQNPKAESAEILLGKIAAAKAAFVKVNKLKAPAPEVPIRESDMAFDLPRGWVWAKLADLCLKLGAGSTPLGGKNIYQSHGIKFLRSQNVWNDGLQLDDVAFISPAIHEGMGATKVEAGDILLNITGASIGRCAVVPDDFDEANVSQHVAIVRLADKSLRHFIHLCAIAPDFQERIMDVQVGVSREGLSMTRLKDFVVALPPLAEQWRIVAKVDELMALCDELAARQQARHAARDQLQQSALARLTAGVRPSPVAATSARTRAAELSQAARTLHLAAPGDGRTPAEFVLREFAELTATPDALPQLRQAILQLAVQGRLVPQNPKDESAERLVVQIRKDIDSAVKAERMKRKRPLPPISEEALPFSLPSSWTWVQLGELSAAEPNAFVDGPFGSKLKTEHYVSDLGYAVIRLGNLGEGQFIWGKEGHIKKDHYESLETNHVAPGDLIIAGLAEPLGRCCEVPQELGPAVNKADCFKFRPHPAIERRYIMLYMNSPVGRQLAEASNHGITRSRINSADAKALPIALPPVAEQKRIVARVEALLRQCDALESQLRQTRILGAHLLDSTLHHLLAA